ncbi:MAG: hypothetical protein A2600_02845 [Candidatus Lambdaproteobacteria bacterium RIFOXYD1_FULL_56_27]|uniref:DUF2851 family protein n=1 Tax=Candidatus Lambdaproteobacteria bacterium RIFOXYD2_FULL_56_26 TaxID=1817773 RepID=A0A1F6H2U7_9PROT|nr:MAG: hypothetical protein A2557_06910 [Candidatus Lambdaproteobacteria bacterium RIFOXYD2_FULL_56_26]OGH05335.1 MAG: hypothetical protein A2426_05235 [Candidatus Lambdaproteobacteria bacterium RIFOXYC1_FULL_56_13]OGH09177.1 MAG: hypothetical protein A2600_02845 [Candidatus Lambdaproteobacteria bacterium RIFOXYD1_FULL_56_27]
MVQRSSEKNKSAPQHSCSAHLTPARLSRLGSLIFQASEQRQIQKSERLALTWGKGLEGAQTELLGLLFRCLGYSHYSEAFEALALRHPWGEVAQLLALPQAQGKVLGLWLGELGLWEGTQGYESLAQHWGQFKSLHPGLNALAKVTPKGRPSNHPARRLTGLYYHLEAVHQEGLAKSWLRFFYQAEQLLQAHKNPLPKLLAALDQQFPSPETEPLVHLSAPSSVKLIAPQRLIGESRQRILLINGLMPFFLSWAIFSQDKGLQKTLFALFLLLPAEGENHKTQAMESRLGLTGPQMTLRRNLAYHQGLIQFYDQLCETYLKNQCQGCPLPGWVGG